VGPELSYLAETGRIKPRYVTDEQAVEGFDELSRTEGIIPALESSHAVAYVLQKAESGELGETVIINLSGRGDKDLESLIRRRDGQ
jgi:tryptophan synthase beta chain